MSVSFENMCQRNGAYSLPYLIYLHDVNSNIQMYFVNNVNDDSDVTYDGNTYKASTFSYSVNTESYGFDGGGKLEIEVANNSVINLVETYNHIILEVVGAIDLDGEVTAIKTYKHEYGKVRVSKSSASFEFEKDDRLDMTFPTLIWSTQNNRGNS